MNRTSMMVVLLTAFSLSARAGIDRPFIYDAYTALLLHLNEATLGTVVDNGEYSNNGIEAGTSIVSGKFSNARHFNGDGSSITVADPVNGSLDFSALQSFTVEAWFRTTSSATQTIIRKGLAPVPGYLLQMIGGKVVGNIGSYNENIYVFQSENRYDDGQWHHAALVADRKLANISLYVDEQLAATPVADMSPFSVANDHPLTIGRWENSSWPYYFTGDIDEVRISSIARYAPGDTVACWRLDEPSGSNVADSSPYHHDGTAYNATIVPGETGNARTFDLGSYVYVPDPKNGILGFSATESFTVEASFKTTYAATQEIVRRGLAPTPGYLIQMIDGKVVGNVGSYDTNIHVFESTRTYNDGQWHHTVMVTDRDQAKIFLYVDGALAITPVEDTQPFAVHNDRCLTIGRWENDSWPYYFHGAIDNVVVLKGAHHPYTTPHISVAPDSLAFGVVSTGKAASLNLTISNSSTQQQLSVQLLSTNPHFTASADSFRIAAPGTQVIAVAYCPTAAEPDTGSLLLASNDPDHPLVRIPLSGWGGFLPPWSYTITGTSHTVIIPTSANIGVSGALLVAGDYIGVFHDSLGTPRCAGFECWTGIGSIAVAAFGDDATTVGKDGFETGEVFQWKIFKAFGGGVTNVDVAYSSPGGIVTHTNTFANNGISKLRSLTEGNTTQRLILRNGWSLISSTVVPNVPTLDTVFSSVLQHLVIVKNGKQKSYIPAVPVNTIGGWNSVEGYQVKMSAVDTLFIRGSKIVLQNESPAIPAGWSIMPYLRDSSMAIAGLLGGISSSVIIVKDQDGKTYIPSQGVNTIGNLTAGQGYFIKTNAACSFQYPATSEHAEPLTQTKRVSANSKANADAPAWYFNNTGESHTVIIPLSSAPSVGGSALAAGGYIGAFYDSSGTLACAGYEMWTGKTNIAVPLFGDDPTTSAKDGFAAGETFRWKIWRPSNGVTYTGNPSYLTVGSLNGVVTDTGKYQANGISAISSLAGSPAGVQSADLPGTFSLAQNFPNPFNPVTSIEYTVGVVSGQLSVASYVRLIVYDALGREIATLVNEKREPGRYVVKFDGSGLSSGFYVYRLTAGDFVESRTMLLVR